MLQYNRIYISEGIDANKTKGHVGILFAVTFTFLK